MQSHRAARVATDTVFQSKQGTGESGDDHRAGSGSAGGSRTAGSTPEL